MTDPIDDLTVRTAFARLRADASTAIHPPGVAAADRSVRRRRYVASAAGGLTALLLLSSGTAAALWRQAPDGAGPAPVMTAASPSTAKGPSAGAADPRSLMTTTETALTDLVGDDAMLFLHAPWSGGERDRALEVRGKDPVTPGPGQPDTSPRTYRVTVVCGGADGEATATFATGGATATATARCAATAEEISAGSATTTVEVGDPTDLTAELKVRPDAPGEDRVVMVALEPAD